MNNWLIIKKESADSYFIEEYLHTSGMKIVFIDGILKTNLMSFCISNNATNSSGVAHVLEHLIIRNSKAFGERNVLMELGGESLNYFYNALTVKGHSYYQTGTNDIADFYNLLGILFTSIFAQKFNEELFRIEGKVVVPNEMNSLYENYDVKVLNDFFYTTKNGFEKFDQGGVPSILEKLTFNELVSYYIKNYKLNNTLLLLVTSEDKVKVLSEISNLISQRVTKNLDKFEGRASSFSREGLLPNFTYREDSMILSFSGTIAQQDSLCRFMRDNFLPKLNHVKKIDNHSNVKISNQCVLYCRFKSKIDTYSFSAIQACLQEFICNQNNYSIYRQSSFEIEHEVNVTSVDFMFEILRNMSLSKNIRAAELKSLIGSYPFFEDEFKHALSFIKCTKIELNENKKYSEEFLTIPDEILDEIQSLDNHLSSVTFTGIQISNVSKVNHFNIVDNNESWTYSSNFFKNSYIVLGKLLIGPMGEYVLSRAEARHRNDHVIIFTAKYMNDHYLCVIGEEQAEADIALFLANVEKEIHESIPLLGASEELELFSLFGIHQGMISYSITQLRKNAMPVIPLEKKLPKIILTSKSEPNKSINLAKNHNEDILRVNSPKVIKDLVINQSTFGKGSHVGICLVKFSVKHIAAMDIYASYLSLYFLPNEIRDKCGAYTVGARIIYDQKYFSITISRLLDPKAAYDKILSELFILPNISNVVFEKAKLLSIGSFDYPMDLREAAKWSWGLNVSGWHINEISTYKETIINMSLDQLYHLVNDVSELGDQVRLLVKV